MKYILMLLLSTHSFAYTLNTNINANFDKSEVKIWVTSNSSCSNIGLSANTILDKAVDAAEKFWNRIPTSYLRIRKGGILQTTDTKYITGKLCVSDSTTVCDSSISVPKAQDIVIACNTNTTDNFKSSSYLAISIPNNFSGSNIEGSIILLNDSSNTILNTLSSAEIENVLGHEMGHAIGLGHTDDNAALMYHTEFSNQHRLAQDDIDGATYLYPNKLHGISNCSGVFGTIDTDKSNKKIPFNFLSLFILGFISISYIVRRKFLVSSKIKF